MPKTKTTTAAAAAAPAQRKRRVDFVLQGTIEPITPINIARADAPKDTKGVPMMTVVQDGGGIPVANVPGETFKGMLRAISADLATRAQGKPPGLDLYMTVFKGGIKGSDKEGTDDLLRTQAYRENHPVLGLYGSAHPYWLAGTVAVGPAFTTDRTRWDITSSGGARRDDFRLDPERLGSMEPAEIESYMRYAAVNREVSAARRKGEDVANEIRRTRSAMRKGDIDDAEGRRRIKELEVAQAAAKAEFEEAKKSDDYKNAIGRPLDSKLGIAPGSRLDQRIDLISATEAEAGLFLETLRELRHCCRIGGFKSIGYGFFAASWSLMVRDDPDRDFEPAGSISVRPQEFALEVRHPIVERCLAAWAARAQDPDSLTVDLGSRA